MKKHFLLSAFFIANCVSAHSVWIAPQHGELSIIYGMGYANDAYPAEKVTFVKGYSADFTSTAVEKKPFEHYTSIQVDKETAVLTAAFDNGYWEKGTSQKWQAVDKDKIKSPADTSTSLKYNITVLGSYQGKMKPFAELPVQIVPDTNPTILSQGDQLGITVFVDGQPAANIPVTADYVNDMGNQMNTDDNGHLTVTIRNSGNNVIAALVNHPTPQDSHAHLQRSVASLSFKAGKPQPHKH